MFIITIHQYILLYFSWLLNTWSSPQSSTNNFILQFIINIKTTEWLSVWQVWNYLRCKELTTDSYTSCKCKYDSEFYILIRLLGWSIDRSCQIWQKINQEMTKQTPILQLKPNIALDWNTISVGCWVSSSIKFNADNGVTVVVFSLHFPIWLAIYLVWIILLTGA